MSNTANPDTLSRIDGAWFGLAVGDVLGAPYEFRRKKDMPSIPNDLHMKAGRSWAVGEWTDDTALTLATAKAYADGQFSPSKAGDAMATWLARDGKGAGKTTRQALTLIRHGHATYKTAGGMVAAKNPDGAANGSLMRTLPTALVRAAHDPRLAYETRVLSRITHAASRCVDACVSYNHAVATLLAGGDVSQALKAALADIDNKDVIKTVQRIAQGKHPLYVNKDGIGFVLLAFERALCAVRDAVDFPSAMVDVIRQGGDTDTNAAIAGGLLGARFGYKAIPKHWLAALMRRGHLTASLRTLLRARESESLTEHAAL